MKKYLCVARSPELDIEGSEHCILKDIEGEDEYYLCPCGNTPNFVPFNEIVLYMQNTKNDILKLIDDRISDLNFYINYENATENRVERWKYAREELIMLKNKL